MQTKKIANGMSFVNDEDVIGKWECFSTIYSFDEFDPERPSVNFDMDFKEIYFLPEGEKYWIFEGWTKGFLLIHYGGDEPILCYTYSIQQKGVDKFLFIVINDDSPRICVMKKTSDKHYKLPDIGHRDNIEVPFVMDEHVLGVWQSVGFVEHIEDFSPKAFSCELWLKAILFEADGAVARYYNDEVWEDRWTKGFLLDRKKSTASAYTFRNINGVEYLFLEWKMGNYVYGGMAPSYYVFVRDKQG